MKITITRTEAKGFDRRCDVASKRRTPWMRKGTELGGMIYVDAQYLW